MAYMSQEKKKALAPAIKAVLKKYGMKGTLGVHHHSTLILNIQKGELDILEDCYQDDIKNELKGGYPAEKKDYLTVNTYWIKEHYTGKIAMFLKEVHEAMMEGNHNNSDIMTDYFDIGWYTEINVGKWNKPYVLL